MKSRDMKSSNLSEVNRRDFLAGGSFATMMMLMGGVPLNAAEDKPAVNPDGTTNYKAKAVPVNVGVIGCGIWGRELLKTLALLPHGPVVAIADTYPAYLKRAASLAPNAQQHPDVEKLLADPKVEAVVVATPSHLHKDVVLAALKAGKHVYCEAPLAATIEDARAIAAAAKASLKLNFQAGLQSRSDKQIINLSKFVRSGAAGNLVKARQQFHKKQTWRLASPNPEREKEINWRLDKAVSLGLTGELGIHQVDVANWFFANLPLAVSGYGSIIQKDGRELPDNVAVRLEYPDGIFLNYEVTIDSTFDTETGLFFGTNATIMMRERRAWMFKELDAPLLGWEVYGKKEAFYKESGIVLGAGATKQDAQEKKTDKDAPATAAGAPSTDLVDEISALQYSLDSFLVNSHMVAAGVKDFTDTYGDDPQQLRDYLKDQEKNRLPAAGWKEGYESAVTVIKANEAALKDQKIVFDKEWFNVA